MASTPLTELMLTHPERTFEVDAQNRIEIGLQHVQKVGCLENSGIVHQHVNSAMNGHDLRHQCIDLGLVTHIAMHIQATHFMRQGRAARVVDIGYDHLRTFACKAANAGLANALRTAGDDANAAGESEIDGGGAGVHRLMVAAFAAPQGRAVISACLAPRGLWATSARLSLRKRCANTACG